MDQWSCVIQCGMCFQENGIHIDFPWHNATASTDYVLRAAGFKQLGCSLQVSAAKDRVRSRNNKSALPQQTRQIPATRGHIYELLTLFF